MAKLKRVVEANKINDLVTEKQHVTRENAGLEYIESRSLGLDQGGEYTETLDGLEVCVVALTGRVTVSDGEQTFSSIGTRDSVFEKCPTDSVYVASGKTITVTAESTAKVLLCYAPSTADLPTTLIKASDNTTEHRGKYNNKRQVHNILDDQSPISDKLIVVEVYTGGGNWSSYPPHKHDQDNLPYESFLEETYYHEVNPPQGFVFQRVYTDDRSLDETMTVENEEMVIVPVGYHPVAVPDGYESYYLNIMAGPTKKWQFHNDPDHEWILSRD